jgi:tetratricopeptide (TPR) repeat protein
MTTPGRNDPCRCGSGKKYKKCCLRRDEEAAALSAPRKVAPAASPPPATWTLVEDELDLDSNRVVTLLREGRLDEAEQARDTLRERYPDTIDWIERTAMIHEARGHLREAIAWWERTLRYMESEDGFDDEGRDDIRGLIDRLRTKADAAEPVTP